MVSSSTAAMLLAVAVAVVAADTVERTCAAGACADVHINKHMQMKGDDLEDDLLSEVTLLQTKVAAVDGHDQQQHEDSEEDVLPTGYRSVQRIICPFLSTLINEGVLENKDLYTKEELNAITLQAGIDVENATAHLDGNFENNPSGVQDLFAMEGAPNEHFTSTGIHDCPTMFYNCDDCADGIKSCTNLTLDCEVPNAAIFDKFWYEVDANSDGFMSTTELSAYTATDTFPFIVDVNPIGGGTIFGSFQFILDVFGTPRSERISRNALFRIFIRRRFPRGYVFPPPL
mmetsp:Transcript_7421/g.16334  ORF Transcript_7421/g.16334 Transcript_7421/m.16334 type:complete len:287 (+) Transcript_7421:112-972(+)